MILTTPTKQPFTTTKHNHKSYILLYLFMLLCVVGNCLLFYCSCLGNCENCCGINGSVSVNCGGTSVSGSDNEFENEIKNTLKNNLGKVYKCSVKRKEKEIKPQITAVEEYKEVEKVKEYKSQH